MYRYIDGNIANNDVDSFDLSNSHSTMLNCYRVVLRVLVENIAICEAINYMRRVGLFKGLTNEITKSFFKRS